MSSYQIPVFLLLLMAMPTIAQQRDPEWPCIQVLVPEIVTAVVWPQQIVEAQIDAWQKDPTLNAMVDKLSDLDAFTDVERQLIADFAASVQPTELGATLNKLAAGIVSQSNQRRSLYINGIKRYTRQQISIAAQIESTLNQLAELDAQPDANATGTRVEIEETLYWHQRVYDRREKAITSLCERPVELEETLSNVLRELAQYLP